MLRKLSISDFEDSKFGSNSEVLFTFAEDNIAYMYFGNTPVQVDYNTALYILHQKDSMPQGNSWPEDFPAIINTTSTTAARKHPAFEAAKKGDFEAALRLVNDMVKDEKVYHIVQTYPNAHIIYNHRMKGDGINMIPAAYAAMFEAAGMQVEHNVVGITNVSHTGASDISRICKRMRYEGNINQGTDYILLDDFITSGAELRDLRDYVESKGGHVVLISTLGHGSYSKLSDIRIDIKYKEKLLNLGITDKELQKYGIASKVDCLTLGEAAKLSRVVECQTKKQFTSNRSGVQHLDQRKRDSQTMGREIPESGTVCKSESSSKVHEEQSVTVMSRQTNHHKIRR